MIATHKLTTDTQTQHTHAHIPQTHAQTTNTHTLQVSYMNAQVYTQTYVRTKGCTGSTGARGQYTRTHRHPPTPPLTHCPSYPPKAA